MSPKWLPILITPALLAIACRGDGSSPTASPTPSPSPAVTRPSPTPERTEIATASPMSTPTATRTQPPQPPLGDAPYRMIIESIGVDVPVQTLGLDANSEPEVPMGDDAGQVVAWYDFSAPPGTGSNAVFAGHAYWQGPAAFYRLDELQPGDAIKLSRQDGPELACIVAWSRLVDPNDPSSLDVMRPTDDDVITIIAEAGSFIGGAWSQRLIVRVELAPTSLTSPG